LGCDIDVSDNSNANRDSFTSIGTGDDNRVYANDTAVKEFFTGAPYLTVKEFEAFEIAD
jgi:hypothetical protein